MNRGLTLEYEFGKNILTFASGRRVGLRAMPSIAAVAAQVLDADLPVLFADTCSLVDELKKP